LQRDFVGGRVVDLLQGRDDLVPGRRGIERDGDFLGRFFGLNALHTGQFAQFALDGVGAMSTANVGHHKGLGSHAFAPSAGILIE
jgi:hypothetical protein